jgi:hypothetical protein
LVDLDHPLPFPFGSWCIECTQAVLFSSHLSVPTLPRHPGAVRRPGGAPASVFLSRRPSFPLEAAHPLILLLRESRGAVLPLSTDFSAFERSAPWQRPAMADARPYLAPRHSRAPPLTLACAR